MVFKRKWDTDKEPTCLSVTISSLFNSSQNWLNITSNLKLNLALFLDVKEVFDT